MSRKAMEHLQLGTPDVISMEVLGIWPRIVPTKYRHMFLDRVEVEEVEEQGKVEVERVLREADLVRKAMEEAKLVREVIQEGKEELVVMLGLPGICIKEGPMTIQ